MKAVVVYDSTFGNTAAVARSTDDAPAGEVQHVRDGQMGAPAECFLVDGKEGPLKRGEVKPARAWLRHPVEVDQDRNEWRNT